MGKQKGLDRETQQAIDGIVDGFRATVTELVIRERSEADQRAREALMNEIGSALDVPKERRRRGPKRRKAKKKTRAAKSNGASVPRLGKTQKKIIDVLARAKAPLKTAEVAKRTKVGANQTSMTLAALSQRGVVARIGTSKPFTWDLK